MNMLCQNVEDEINKVIKGKAAVVENVLAAIISGGHILMEDVPGVGKTTLATTFAKALSLDYKRVQFTPDVLPSDVLGFSMYNEATHEFEYRAGAIFCNLFLADEINRTSPKTQSALLEAMEEGQATVDGQTRQLPNPFIVIATQNPLGSSGTQPLPESQLDRFMVCLSMGYPEHDDAIGILKGESWKMSENVKQILDMNKLIELRNQEEKVFVHDSIYDYIVSIVEMTRTHQYFSYGASPRGTIAMLKMARAMAVLDDRDFVTALDVQKVIKSVLNHRVKLASSARLDNVSVDDALMMLVKEVKAPRI